jgi:hypothetical protein
LRSNEHPLEKGLSCVNMRATAMDAKGLWLAERKMRESWWVVWYSEVKSIRGFSTRGNLLLGLPNHSDFQPLLQVSGRITKSDRRNLENSSGDPVVLKKVELWETQAVSIPCFPLQMEGLGLEKWSMECTLLVMDLGCDFTNWFSRIIV